MRNGRNMLLPYPGKSMGAALLIMLFVMVLAFSAVLVTLLAKSNTGIERQQKTIKALAQAKQALIAWSVMQGDMQPATVIEEGEKKFTYYRPGTLPCPDKYFFGQADTGYASANCSTGGETSIGRLPWKSLSIERLRDAYGESLWYAVSNNFRSAANNLNSNAINSDTKGSLLLYAADGTTLLTPPGEELAAIVFAPGPPLAGQDRAALPDSAISYLEEFNGKNNASAAGPFVMGPVKDSNGNLVTNDYAIGITARELIAALEKRVLKEAQYALKTHFTEKGKFPNPAPHNAANCTSIITNVKSVPLCASDSSTPACFGRLPEDVLSNYVAPWFMQNGWGRVMTYAINDNIAGCTTSLNVEGKPKNYVLITPGAARYGQSRPSTSLSDYLEDSSNVNGWSANPDFIVPSASSNDQLRAEP